MNRWTDQLYAIIDSEIAADPLALAREVLSSGCAMMQLRVKRLDDRSFLELARQLRRACTDASVPFVINDRADIALLVGADGLHLGQEDMSVSDARKVVGEMQIGLSTHNLEQALEAERCGADLIAFGPIFPTRTKEDPDPVVGLDRLASVCRSVSRPVVAIGGITPQNGLEVLQAGARYIAAISAVPSFLSDRA